MRDITLGQYYPADSIIHRLDPRVKIFSTIIFIIAVFAAKGAAGFVLLTAGFLTVVFLTKIPVRYLLKGLKSILVLIVITAFFNFLFTPGEKIFWRMGVFVISDRGIVNTVVTTIRLGYLVMGASVMTLTTTPNRLTDGMEEAMKPLNRIHIPVHAIAMMMSIALRFIPILMEEADRIKMAQMARGADFESGNMIKRAKSMIPLLIPLFVSAFRRADDLALAMEARCYTGGEGRTRMYPLRYEKRDGGAYLCSVLFLTAVVILRIYDPWPQ